MGVIGLGAGTLAAYGNASDYFRFYEINPLVVSIAKNWFSYLRDTPAKVDIAMGDARLSLAAEPSQQYDVLAVDAFSGDAIPVHLLTKEAFALYLRHLKPGGILAVHTSNTYLDLAPVVQLLADDVHYPVRLITNGDDLRKLIDTSDWVLVTRNEDFLRDLDATTLEPVSYTHLDVYKRQSLSRGLRDYNLNSSRNRLVCTRLTGISVCFLSFIFSM